jgi:hypothetical protein
MRLTGERLDGPSKKMRELLRLPIPAWMDSKRSLKALVPIKMTFLLGAAG